MAEDALRKAITTSGFPLQILVAAALKDRGFYVEEEWAYIDPESDDRRALDVVGVHSHSSEAAKVGDAGSFLSLRLLIECKRSEPPSLFFEAVSPPALNTFPPIVGIGDGKVEVRPPE